MNPNQGVVLGWDQGFFSRGLDPDDIQPDTQPCVFFQTQVPCVSNLEVHQNCIRQSIQIRIFGLYLVDETTASLLVLPVLDGLVLGDVGLEGDRLATDANLHRHHYHLFLIFIFIFLEIFFIITIMFYMMGSRAGVQPYPY